MTDQPVFRELDPIKDAALIDKLADRVNRSVRSALREAWRESK
jgi:hypothetical protein